MSNNDQPFKPTRIIDIFSSKAVLIFIVSAAWFVKGKLDQLDAVELWMRGAQPTISNLVETSASLKTATENLASRVDKVERNKDATH